MKTEQQLKLIDSIQDKAESISFNHEYIDSLVFVISEHIFNLNSAANDVMEQYDNKNPYVFIHEYKRLASNIEVLINLISREMTALDNANLAIYEDIKEFRSSK